MNRREILKMIAAATGTAFVGSNALAYDMVPKVKLADTGFSKDDVAYLNEIGETIIPRTDTPGAKDANVGLTMAIMVADCYSQPARDAFKQGMVTLKQAATNAFGKDFLLLTSEQKLTLLTELDEEAKLYNQKMHELAEQKTEAESSVERVPHYFSLMKQLVLFSFFTSEIGANKVLRYVAIPSRYDGEFPYKKGDRAWAT
ncbi:gluconate 2-dehydrogenase subunit 3 family protein [Aliiglaciecola sp. LCG003]|uniref:gluconate 2-dehydrogenase subunit 3 family protein n=1 Tax=Aliiglaciecola sp. LCG003 TaxID=3053655 RepID=UPI0025729BFB|nr:gluconate 2-dehydrogenase subunit 3 family protein [Aliiglaciecola sp. LCG003]WJG10870.1 gluconate 2-dehydrogenase subunit 3 family protein [Aliiglaciecola sp. LCG003]